MNTFYTSAVENMDKDQREMFDKQLTAEPQPPQAPKPFEGEGNRNVQALMLLTRTTPQQANPFGQTEWDPRKQRKKQK